MTDLACSQALDAVRAHAGARRPRLLRRTAALRDLVRETTLAPDDLVYPFFVVPGEGVRTPIPSMPGIEQLSVDALAGEARDLGGPDRDAARRLGDVEQLASGADVP